MKIALVLTVVVLLAGCSEKPAPVTAKSKDPKITAVEERAAKTTPEGKQMIEKVQGMKANVNGLVSTKTIGEMVDDYAKNKGAYNITPIAWEAAQKKTLPNEKTGRWKVMFSYQDYSKQFLAAEWEFNPDTNEVYPFEKDNAPQFYSDEGAKPAVGKAKK